MKKRIFFAFIFVLFSLIGVVSGVDAVETKGYDFKDLRGECFVLSAVVSEGHDDIFQVSLNGGEPVFFVQNDKFLPNKLFSAEMQRSIDYDLISIQGADYDERDVAFLNDGNPQTGIKFDPYKDVEMSVTIQFSEELRGGSFIHQLSYSSDLRPEYEISQDGEKYIAVKDLGKYDLRFLKIYFRKSLHNTNPDRNLMINELGFLGHGKDIYLVKTQDSSPVNIYTYYKCDSAEYKKVVTELGKISAATTFPININTQLFDVDWSPNSSYNSDFDSDLVLNDFDNCPFVINKNQEDKDKDLLGDACDYNSTEKNFFEKDRDRDGVGDSDDNCPDIYNPRQEDGNADKKGDLCVDDDGDRHFGYKDNCRDVFNPKQEDVNNNGVGDACEFDLDNDGIFDSIDNCNNKSNSDQLDSDKDGVGDICDNCELYNPSQIDRDNSLVGDECETRDRIKKNNDWDQDGILDNSDNCPRTNNQKQEDQDGDGVGDVCDNCLDIKNTDQQDKDKNAKGDVCEDGDRDGMVGYRDNCIYHPNSGQDDKDNDGVGDVCEDEDADGVVVADDNCPFDDNSDQSDVDHDNIGDVCDPKDDRIIEANSTFFTIFIVLVSLIFGGLIFLMIRRLGKEGQAGN